MSSSNLKQLLKKEQKLLRKLAREKMIKRKQIKREQRRMSQVVKNHHHPQMKKVAKKIKKLKRMEKLHSKRDLELHL
jgi:hypothetical protein